MPIPPALPAPDLPAPDVPDPGSDAHRAVLHASALFMPGHYLHTHPELAASGLGPLDHYCRQGWRDNRSANPWFDPAYYLACSPLPPARTDPLLHYALLGSRAGARPNAGFDPVWYRAAYMAEHDPIDPLAHYVAAGESLDHRPCLAFDTAWYRHRHRLQGSTSPLLHYLARRHTTSVSPLPEFDVAWYCRMRRDVVALGADPFEHYLEHGWREGQDPSPSFQGAFYARRYLPRGPRTNPLLHYLAHRHELNLLPTLHQALHHDLETEGAAGLRRVRFPLCWRDGIAINIDPLRVFLANPSLAFGFQLVWSNEHLAAQPMLAVAERDLLQAYQADDSHDADICALARTCFADPRCTRHDGRPALAFYTPAGLDEMASQVVRRWTRYLPDAMIHLTRLPP